MQPRESSLLILILVNFLLLAYSQKCDLTLYNAPCGAMKYFTHLLLARQCQSTSSAYP